MSVLLAEFISSSFFLAHFTLLAKTNGSHDLSITMAICLSLVAICSVTFLIRSVTTKQR